MVRSLSSSYKHLNCIDSSTICDHYSFTWHCLKPYFLTRTGTLQHTHTRTHTHTHTLTQTRARTHTQTQKHTHACRKPCSVVHSLENDFDPQLPRRNMAVGGGNVRQPIIATESHSLSCKVRRNPHGRYYLHTTEGIHQSQSQ